MTNIIINPGSEDVPAATIETAWINIGHFIAELSARGVEVTAVQRVDADDDGGRYNFRLHTADDRDLDIDMPGVEVAREGTPWVSPRLYVDGSSWLWEYALNSCEPDDEDEGEDIARGES